MKSCFSFKWKGSLEGGTPLDFQFLFKAPGEIDAQSLAEAIEGAVQQRLYPDVILVACSTKELRKLIASFKSNLSLKQVPQRCSTKVCLCLAGHDENGDVSNVTFLANAREDVREIVQKHLGDIIEAGLTELFRVEDVVVKAPPGFEFIKPSRDSSTTFLRTEECLYEVERTQFLALALLKRLSARDKIIGTPVDVIYIDSMAISSVAYALRELYCDLLGHQRPRVVSFHSHYGLKNLRTPMPGTSFCLISASSSMNLERDWINVTKCDPYEVVTILTIEGAVGSERAVYRLPKSNDNEVIAQELRPLPIVGERFLPTNIPPRLFLLRKPAHVTTVGRQIGRDLSDKESIRINAASTSLSSRLRPVFIDGSKLLKNQAFKKFLSETLDQWVASSVQAIVYQDDDDSKKLAKVCSVHLKEKMKRTDSLKLISALEIEALSDIDLNRSDAVLVVAAVIGRGSNLLSISRDLRDKHGGAKTYLVGVQVAETNAQIKILGANLGQTSGESRSNLKTFSAFAIGRHIKESFTAEQQLLKKNAAAYAMDFYRNRCLTLDGETNGFNGDALLPALPEMRHLELRDDFSFWDPGYKGGQRQAPGVIATIASLLQNAREAAFKDDLHRFSTGAFQQVILDPENFTRYNDGILQAALLRTCLPSELDYSADANASRQMLDLLIKVFRLAKQRQGEAALEFANALATSRLRLTKGDMHELHENLKGIANDMDPHLEVLLFLKNEPADPSKAF